MILTEKHYRAERILKEDDPGYAYQGFHVVVEAEGNRKYLVVKLDNTTRWRSKEEYADYLRWAANMIETLED